MPNKVPMFGHKLRVGKIRHLELDEIDRLYHTQRWFRFRRYMLARNPICQRVERNGEQCYSPATELHHAVSPRVDIDRFLDASNIRCLCRRHHHKTEGEDVSKGYKYVPTVT